MVGAVINDLMRTDATNVGALFLIAYILLGPVHESCSYQKPA